MLQHLSDDIDVVATGSLTQDYDEIDFSLKIELAEF